MTIFFSLLLPMVTTPLPLQQQKIHVIYTDIQRIVHLWSSANVSSEIIIKKHIFSHLADVLLLLLLSILFSIYDKCHVCVCDVLIDNNDNVLQSQIRKTQNIHSKKKLLVYIIAVDNNDIDENKNPCV